LRITALLRHEIIFSEEKAKCENSGKERGRQLRIGVQELGALIQNRQT